MFVNFCWNSSSGSRGNRSKNNDYPIGRQRQTVWKYDKIMLFVFTWNYKGINKFYQFYLQRTLTEDADFCCVNYYNDGISCKGMMSDFLVTILERKDEFVI